MFDWPDRKLTLTGFVVSGAWSSGSGSSSGISLPPPDTAGWLPGSFSHAMSSAESLSCPKVVLPEGGPHAVGQGHADGAGGGVVGLQFALEGLAAVGTGPCPCLRSAGEQDHGDRGAYSIVPE
jgi:hypothetical protein